MLALKRAGAALAARFDGAVSPWPYAIFRVGLALVVLVRTSDVLRPVFALDHHGWVRGLEHAPWSDPVGDGCPDGESGCAGPLVAGVWLGCTGFSVRVSLDIPASDPRVRAFVELSMTADILVGDWFVVQATTSVPSVGVSGARFLDVKAGTRLEFTVYAESGYHADGPIRGEATLRFVDDTGVVLEERPFLVVVPDCCPILI